MNVIKALPASDPIHTAEVGTRHTIEVCEQVWTDTDFAFIPTPVEVIATDVYEGHRRKFKVSRELWMWGHLVTEIWIYCRGTANA